MGTIATFYSYKGGTGRSMALANVAWILASSGARVLVVDWDLEAPGLHRYFRPFLIDKELNRLESRGLIDCMVDFTERLATPENPSAPRDQRWMQQHADLEKWSTQLLWPSGEDAVTPIGGRIDFVPAGRQDPQYAKHVNSFDWAAFYERSNGGAFIDAVRSNMTRYDWTLIDSRTGVSDTSGICTVQLPDVLVVCFTLNYQSIDGAAAVAASARAGRSRPLRILPVPMRLDGNEEKLLKAMMAYAQTAFRPLMDPRYDAELYWQEMGVPYFSRYAYAEKLAPFEDQVNVTTSTLPAMERLTSYITERTVTSLNRLPEAHRTAALAEFERTPDAAHAPQAAVAAAASAGVTLQRLWYRYGRLAWIALVALVLLGVTIYVGMLRSAPTPGAIPVALIPAMIDDARKALEAEAEARKNNDSALAQRHRERRALLIAEAAARLGPDSVVGPDGEPGRHVYEALMALQPFRLGDSRPRSSAPDHIVFSPDANWIASALRGQPSSLLPFPPAGVPRLSLPGYSAVAFSPDSRFFATGGRNGSLNVFDLTSGRLIWQWENLDPDSAWANAIAFSPNGNLLAAGSDRGAVITAGVEPWRLQEKFNHVGGVESLAFSADSAVVITGGLNGTVRAWPVRPTRFSLAGPGEPVSGRGPIEQIVVTPGSQPLRVFARARDGSGGVWRWNGTNLQVTNLPASRALAVSPDGQLLVTFDAVTGVISSLGSDKAADRRFTVPYVSAATFSGDGKWLVMGSGDPTEYAVLVWDISRLSEVQRVVVPGPVSALAISSNSRYVAIGSAAGTFAALFQPAGLLALSAGEVRTLACSQAGQTTQLSSEEWRKYFDDEPIRFTCGAAVSRPSVPST